VGRGRGRPLNGEGRSAIVGNFYGDEAFALFKEIQGAAARRRFVLKHV